jgi:hypothetical protein
MNAVTSPSRTLPIRIPRANPMFDMPPEFVDSESAEYRMSFPSM